MACYAPPYGLRYAGHCFNRAPAQQNRPALIPAGGKLGVTSVGIEPANQKILVLKSSVHFRGDFPPIDEAILVALAPGPVVALAEDLPYRNLRHGVRLGPKGPPFTGSSG